ncbi:MAG TPA: c-type cytochrome [Gemmataceae bacterium]|nr:c-type cytochrome [Gemmataceae bacterium]
MRFSRAANRIALLLFLLVGCDWPGKPKDSDRPIPAEQIEDFGKLYGMHCAGCHGADGKDGPAPPLNDPLFLAIVPDEVLHRVITEGRTGTPMTAFAKDKGGPITNKQIHILAHGIKESWKVEKPKQPPPPYLLSDAKAGDKKKGLAVFARDCAMCHGEQGQGGDDAGAIHDTAFLTLVSDQVLRRYIITGRPDFGMPHYADPKRGDADLTSQEINDLVSLLAYWRVGGSVNDK